MSSVQFLREFVNERLSAAAEEIFGVFEKTIVEYEEEIDRQRRLLDIVWKPEIKLQRIELPLQYIYQEEEVLADQQLCIQERNSSLDQEDPEPPQIKEEQEELCTSQEGEQLELKQETNDVMVTSTNEESDHSEGQNFNPDETLSAAEKESVVNIPVISSVVPEANSDQQFLSHNSHKAESQNQKGGRHGDSGPTRNAELEPKKRHYMGHSNNACKIHLDTPTGMTFFKCDACGKEFKDRSRLNRHFMVHTGEKPYFCNTCGRSFNDISTLRRHKTIHTGEKPYPCKTCGKNFRLKSDLKVHMRTHTGEKPYSCNTCGKRYCRMMDLKWHIRITHEKQSTCETWESSEET